MRLPSFLAAADKTTIKCYLHASPTDSHVKQLYSAITALRSAILHVSKIITLVHSKLRFSVLGMSICHWILNSDLGTVCIL